MFYNAKKRLAAMHWHNGNQTNKFGLLWLFTLEKEYL